MSSYICRYKLRLHRSGGAGLNWVGEYEGVVQGAVVRHGQGPVALCRGGFEAFWNTGESEVVMICTLGGLRYPAAAALRIPSLI